MSPKMVYTRATASRVYTHAEILEWDYPELWDKAQELVVRLTTLQENIIPTLPKLHHQLPANIQELQTPEAQINLQSYILARSLYGFAERVFTLLDEQCTELAKALNVEDSDAEEDALAKVKRTLEILASAPLEEISSDSVTGLLRLSSVTCEFEHRLDFSVFHMEKADWTFHDIMGTIANSGLCREDLLQDTINCALPTCVSVGKLLDDDTMQRVY
jgi:hypothetical protein